jgi:nucleotide-binding universal stress UspA family protein
MSHLTFCRFLFTTLINLVMKNILVFNDMSPETEHAIELALLLADATNVGLYIWDTIGRPESSDSAELVVAGAHEVALKVPVNKNRPVGESEFHLKTDSTSTVNFIKDIDFAPGNALSVVKKFNIGLLIQGVAKNEDQLSYIEKNALGCSTKSGCPLMLIPERFPCKAFEKIVYATDLRFCRRDLMSFLSQLATKLNASVLVANIAAKGLPYMEDKYAADVFNDIVAHSARASNEHFYFDNIRERDVHKAIDVLVNDMAADLLVLTNHRYHFNELLGSGIPYTLPDYIRIPLLIFPS